MPPVGGDRRRRRRARSGGAALRTMVRETVIVVGMALLLSLVVKTWLVQAFYIPSGSMEDTLVRGDRVIVSKLTPGPLDLHRGDVVVFKDPDHWLDPVTPAERGTDRRPRCNAALTFVGLLPNDADNHLIKRVIGLPGDHVSAATRQGGQLKVNGVRDQRALPQARRRAEPARTSTSPCPQGRVWVMGDHRCDSSDSRFHDLGGDRQGGLGPRATSSSAAPSCVVWPLSDAELAGCARSATFAKVPAGAVAGRKPAVHAAHRD